MKITKTMILLTIMIIIGVPVVAALGFCAIVKRDRI